MEFDRQNRCRTPFLARPKLQAASMYAYRLYNYRCTRSYSVPTPFISPLSLFLFFSFVGPALHWTTLAENYKSTL